MQVLEKENANKNDAQNAMETIPSFSIIVDPLIGKISNGLASVGRLSGTKTKPSDVGAAEIAAFVTLKTKLESDVLFPLKDLITKTEERKSDLKESFKNQRDQIEKIQNMITQIKSNSLQLEQRKRSNEEIAVAIGQRSAAILEAGRTLMPKISQAEADYFNQLKRWEAQCSSWKIVVEKLLRKGSELNDCLRSTTTNRFDLKENEMKLLRDLISGQEFFIKKARDDLNECRRKVTRTADLMGLEVDLPPQSLY